MPGQLVLDNVCGLCDRDIVFGEAKRLAACCDHCPPLHHRAYTESEAVGAGSACRRAMAREFHPFLAVVGHSQLTSSPQLRRLSRADAISSACFKSRPCRFWNAASSCSYRRVRFVKLDSRVHGKLAQVCFGFFSLMKTSAFWVPGFRSRS